MTILDLKVFNLALAFRIALLFLFGIGMAPDSRMFLDLSSSFEYKHSIMYPMLLSVLGPYTCVSIQVILDSATAVLIAGLSPAGGVLYAVSLGPAVYSCFVLTDTVATFFMTVAMIGAIKVRPTLLAGGLLCSIFTREICLLLSPLFIFLYFYGACGSISRPEPSA